MLNTLKNILAKLFPQKLATKTTTELPTLEVDIPALEAKQELLIEQPLDTVQAVEERVVIKKKKKSSKKKFKK